MPNLYCTVEALAAYLTASDLNWTGGDALTDALNAGSRAIDNYCGREFYTTTGTRLFAARSTARVDVDDIATTTGLVVETDDNNDGTYPTTWTINADFLCYPYNTLPVTQLVAVGSRTIPITTRPAVRVTATFGRDAVPEPVRQACLMVSADLWKRRETPLGTQAGSMEFGPIRISGDTFKQASGILAPYRRVDAYLGIA